MDSNEKFIKNIILHKLLSNDSKYGVVYTCYYNDKYTAVKIVSLNSGVHYDAITKKHFNGDKTLIKNIDVEKYYDKNSFIFDQILFIKKKVMKNDAFALEIAKQQKMYELSFSPQIHGYCIYDKLPVHYGFIVMDLVDCTLKDIIMKRDITVEENFILTNFYNIHMKPLY